MPRGQVRFTYSGDTTVPGKVSLLDYRIGRRRVGNPLSSRAPPEGEYPPPTTLELQPNSAVTVRYRIRSLPDRRPGITRP